MEPAKKEKGKAKEVEIKQEKVEIKKERVEKKSEKKVDRVKKPKKEITLGPFDLTEPIELSLADRLGTIAPLLMATGGAIAYTRFPIVQSFVNSAVGQLMESLTSPENIEKSSGARGGAPVPLPPAK